MEKTAKVRGSNAAWWSLAPGLIVLALCGVVAGCGGETGGSEPAGGDVVEVSDSAAGGDVGGDGDDPGSDPGGDPGGDPGEEDAGDRDATDAADGSDTQPGDVGRDAEGSGTDASDGGAEDGESDAAPSDSGDADAGPPRLYSVRGSVFFNEEGVRLSGTLTVGLTLSVSPPEPFVDSATFTPPVLPLNYEFSRLPEGDYYLVAHVDTGSGRPWYDPAPTDYFGRTAGRAYVGPGRPVAPGVNVELFPIPREE